MYTRKTYVVYFVVWFVSITAHFVSFNLHHREKGRWKKIHSMFQQKESNAGSQKAFLIWNIKCPSITPQIHLKTVSSYVAYFFSDSPFVFKMILWQKWTQGHKLRHNYSRENIVVELFLICELQKIKRSMMEYFWVMKSFLFKVLCVVGDEKVSSQSKPL